MPKAASLSGQPTPVTRRTVMAGLGAAAVAAGLPRRALAASSIKFSCDFRVYGGTAPFFYGNDLGFFKQNGITAQIDGSLGSGDAITRVASGAYDFGCADVSTLVEFVSRNPESAPILIMPIYDRTAACIISLAGKPVNTLKDLEGKKLGVSTADAGSRLLPGLLRLHNVDASKIEMITIEQKLRDTLLMQKRVDAVVGFDYTTLFNLIGNGVKKEDVHFVYYSNNGFDFYGQGLIASRKLVKSNPDLAKGVADAVAKSWIAAYKDPDAAIASITKRDALANAQVEKDRMEWVLNHHVMTPNVKAHGLGTMDMKRLDAGIVAIREGFEIKKPLTAKDVWDGRFMPPAADRKVG
ncbi:MAG TPA: ABC transporter substrate-binding protein [Stellaceae bacterium]|jgi:NitT/TauT family transport system substrate-binding protein|nr:ABC transporter substrate-binding protein [Stellaceae bacterium]